MTDTFDYDDLAAEVSLRRMEISSAHAADVLRTRIEAAFVPVEDVTAERDRMVDRIEEWERQIAEATARAEAAEAVSDDVHKALWAAEAENAMLREALRERREQLWHLTKDPKSNWWIKQADQALGGEHER